MNTKTLRNEIIELTGVSKNNFYQNYFTENNNNLRKVWQGIKEVIKASLMMLQFVLLMKIIY